MTYKQQYVKDILDSWLCDYCKEDTDGLAMIILYELGIDPYSADEIKRIDWDKKDSDGEFIELKRVHKLY